MSSSPANPANALAAWESIPRLVHALVDDRSEAELDARADPKTMTPRELVHHIAEANVVAASIVIAALGSPGCVYDWSWMVPAPPWMERLAYGAKPIAPALALVDALNAYVAAQIRPLADGLQRTVQLRDAPGGPLRTATVADVLAAEAEHARHHVDEWRAALR
ncbi:MAG: hypothetical protein EPO68_07655 [Planctomycetota bacterium]|nr:MAG: hypothetical protein EPO68_07655 [Planctomycetota bacterium]